MEPRAGASLYKHLLRTPPPPARGIAGAESGSSSVSLYQALGE